MKKFIHYAIIIWACAFFGGLISGKSVFATPELEELEGPKVSMTMALKPIRCFAEADLLKVFRSNDFEYESIFTRQLNAFENNIGLSIGMSTSGKSKNVLNALQYSNKINSTTCLICGNNELNYENIDFVIKVPSKDTGTIQTVTQVIYHSICQALENQ